MRSVYRDKTQAPNAAAACLPGALVLIIFTRCLSLNVIVYNPKRTHQAAAASAASERLSRIIHILLARHRYKLISCTQYTCARTWRKRGVSASAAEQHACWMCAGGGKNPFYAVRSKRRGKGHMSCYIIRTYTHPAHSDMWKAKRKATHECIERDVASIHRAYTYAQHRVVYFVLLLAYRTRVRRSTRDE